MSKKPICFYHSADLDGKCSAAIVSYFLEGNVNLYGINYGQDFPWDLVNETTDVYMVDFCLQPFEDMVRLRNSCRNLIWIDHHYTAIQAAKTEQFCCNGLLEDGTGACELTWLYMSALADECDIDDVAVPFAVELLSCYDVWKWQDVHNALEFQYGMRAQDNEPESDIWLELFDANPHDHFELVDELVVIGASVLRYQQKQDAACIKSGAFRTEMAGMPVLACNSMPAGSALFDSIWPEHRDEVDAMLVFGWKGSHGMWSVSLYTDKEGVDVSQIAKRYGGGGHRQAAGFQCQVLPLDLLNKQRREES